MFADIILEINDHFKLELDGQRDWNLHQSSKTDYFMLTSCSLLHKYLILFCGDYHNYVLQKCGD